MCFTRLKHLVCVTLLLLLIDKYVVYSVAFISSNSHNNSEEIKSIFHETDLSKHDSGSMLKGNLTANFAEGGTVVTDSKLNGISTLSLSSHNTHKFLSSKNNHVTSTTEGSISRKENISVTVKNSLHKDSKLSTSDINSAASVNKLNDTGINLYLGVPEVNHVNGTSSIKPRKGVYFNKIVPRKGVDIDNETESSFEETCFWVTENECYSSVDFANIDCNCCEAGNNLGKIIVQQSVQNCSNCKPLSPRPLGTKKTCKNLCCNNELLDKEAYSISTSEDVFDHFKHNSSENIIKKEKISENKFWKKSKPKPTITKVPYDVEIVTELLGKANRDVFVPVVVSIFLLPLLGVLMYFIWKRTKEYWEKRYYKRMDFLIDGMYND